MMVRQIKLNTDYDDSNGNRTEHGMMTVMQLKLNTDFDDYNE